MATGVGVMLFEPWSVGHSWFREIPLMRFNLVQAEKNSRSEFEI